MEEERAFGNFSSMLPIILVKEKDFAELQLNFKNDKSNEFYPKVVLFFTIVPWGLLILLNTLF